MLEKAFASSWIQVNTFEVDQSGYTRTYPVLSEYKRLYGGQVIFLCGADLLSTFSDPSVWAPADVRLLGLRR